MDAKNKGRPFFGLKLTVTCGSGLQQAQEMLKAKGTRWGDVALNENADDFHSLLMF